MDRRQFLKTGAAGLALSAAGGYAAEFADRPPLRVGLIGCGWYGKSDLFRLVQVAPVEIVSLCDVDKEEAGDRRADGPWSARPRRRSRALFTDYREMLKQRDLDMVRSRHAGSLARAAHDRSRQGRLRHVRAEAHQRGRGGRARPCWPRPASTSAWCRSGRSGAARRTSSRRATS